MMPSRRLQQILPLALFSVLFGALAYGTGNMLHLALDPAGAAAAHGLAGTAPVDEGDFAMVCGDGLDRVVAGSDADSPSPLRLLPDHCFFCLDGIAPQPVVLATEQSPVAPGPALPRPQRATPAPRVPRRDSDPARGPPALL